MTAKQVFEYTLVELNKKDAPSLLLEDYNYFINKSINQYINRMYNAYEMNQQKTDDLRVLKSTAVLKPLLNDDYTGSNLFGNVYEVNLPDDYLHILGCTVEYKLKKNYKCYNVGDYWQQGAIRTTGDMFPQLINNYYMRPMYKRPYYYINNVTTKTTFPTETNQEIITGKSFNITATFNDVFPSITVKWRNDSPQETFLFGDGGYYELNSKLTSANYTNKFIGSAESPTGIVISDVYSVTTSTPTVTTITENTSTTIDNGNKISGQRYGNNSKVRMEIRYGKDNSIFELWNVYIDYLKVPQFIRLTIDQVEEVEDNSQTLEYPDYVCQEIVNELVKLIMENESNPRLQTSIPVNQSIAMPGQEQQKR